MCIYMYWDVYAVVNMWKSGDDLCELGPRVELRALSLPASAFTCSVIACMHTHDCAYTYAHTSFSKINCNMKTAIVLQQLPVIFLLVISHH